MDPKHRAVEVDFNSASRDGQPFQELITASKILPNVAMRKCTSELKINTADRWCRRVLGWPRHRDLLGIRYDEPRRWKRALMKECRAEYPLMHAGVTEPDVLNFWARSPFDLAIPSHLGNCDLCFLKGRSGLLRVMREEPDRAAWWIEQERQHSRAILETAHLRRAFGRRPRPPAINFPCWTTTMQGSTAFVASDSTSQTPQARPIRRWTPTAPSAA